MQLKNRSLLFPTLLVTFVIMIASGACSQHEPGNFQGGGRGEPPSEIDEVLGNPPPPQDSGPPPQDNFVPPDVKADIVTLD